MTLVLFNGATVRMVARRNAQEEITAAIERLAALEGEAAGVAGVETDLVGPNGRKMTVGQLLGVIDVCLFNALAPVREDLALERQAIAFGLGAPGLLAKRGRE
jgi:hypothetical protein